MNTRFKASYVLAVITALLCSITPALAAPVGGAVDPINTLTSISYVSNITIVGASGLSAVNIVTATINNNDSAGWKLLVESANEGKLFKSGTSGGAGRELTYTNITFVGTGGTLGAGLTNPNGGSKNIATTGDVTFNTGVAVGTPGTATTATVNYTFALRITAAADTSLLSGTYADDITLTLSNDS